MGPRTATLAAAAGGMAAALFTVCAAGVALAPTGTTAVLGDLLDLKLSGLQHTVTWGHFIAAFFVWTTGAALTIGFGAWLYNRFSLPASDRTPSGTSRMTVGV